MAKQTKNYNLTMPESTDFADIAPISENMNKIDEALAKKADLSEDQTVPVSQIPPLGYILEAEKAAPNGVASLDTKGRVPKAQLPALGLLPQILVSNAVDDAAVTATDGVVVVTGAGHPIKKLILPDYGAWTVSALAADGEAVPQSIVVDTVKQYAVSLTWFAATLSVSCPANATVIAINGEHQYTATADAKGHATITVRYKGDYQISYYTDSVGTIPITVTVRLHGETYTVDLT